MQTVLFNMSLFSNNPGSEKQPMYGQVKQMILTGEYQRRTQLPGLQREANTKCFQPAFFPMAGKV